MLTLDSRMHREGRAISKDSDDPAINQALMSAVYAYSVRWIFIDEQMEAHHDDERMRLRKIRHDLTTKLYMQADRYMPAALLHCSYRSILALHLASHVRYSSNQTRESVARMYLQRSSDHHVALQAQDDPECLQRDSLAGLRKAPSNEATSAEPHSILDELETMKRLAYWFGVLSDTSTALLHCVPPLLQLRSTGLNVWHYVQKRVLEFDVDFRYLHKTRTPLSDDRVLEILQAAFISKLLCWSAISKVQDVMRLPSELVSLEGALQGIQDANNQFEDVFTPLLDLCRRDFTLLSPAMQLSYSKLALKQVIHLC